MNDQLCKMSGFLWISIDFYGFLKIFIDFYRFLPVQLVILWLQRTPQTMTTNQHLSTAWWRLVAQLKRGNVYHGGILRTKVVAAQGNSSIYNISCHMSSITLRNMSWNDVSRTKGANTSWIPNNLYLETFKADTEFLGQNITVKQSRSVLEVHVNKYRTKTLQFHQAWSSCINMYELRSPSHCRV